MRSGFALVVAAMLAACSGGGGSGYLVPDGGSVPDDPGDGDGGDGGDGGGEAPTEEPASDEYSVRRAALSSLRQRMVFESGESRTAAAEMPVSGQAVYEGHLAAGMTGAGVDGRQLLGDVSLIASFGDGSIAGRIENFRRSDEVPVRGTLEIRRTEIRGGAEPGFDGVLEGLLTDGVGAIAVEGRARGAFYGTGAGYLAGDISAEITTPDGSGQLTGDFVTE